MLTVAIEGLDELRSEWSAGCDRLSRGIADSVDGAAKHGRGVARNAAPVKTHHLENNIEGSLEERGDLRATGLLESKAKYSSLVAEGTKPHQIRARRKQALAFNTGGAMAFARSVNHPGTPANLFWFYAKLAAKARLHELVNQHVEVFCHDLSR